KALMRHARGRLSDAAEANETEGPAGHQGAQIAHRPPARPGLVADLTLACARTAGDHQYQSECDLGGGLGEHVRGIGHDDTEALAGIDIDVAHAHTVVADDLHLPCTGLQNVGSEPVRDGWTHGIVRTQRRAQLLRSGQHVAIVEGDLVAGSEVALDFGWPTAGQQYLGFRHGWRSIAPQREVAEDGRTEGLRDSPREIAAGVFAAQLRATRRYSLGVMP